MKCMENVTYNTVPALLQVTAGWRKPHDDELHGLYSSPSRVTTSKSSMSLARI
jgi:hypothetical protein